MLKRGSQGQTSPQHFPIQTTSSPVKNHPSFAHSSNNLLIGGGVISNGYRGKHPGNDKPTPTAPPSSSGGAHSSYLPREAQIKKRNTFK